MGTYICLKCGSKNIDDRRRPALSALGGVMLVVAILSLPLHLSPVIDWDHFMSLRQEQMLIVLLLSLGMFLLVKGTETSERVRCRECGKVWTPPQRRIVKPH